MQTVGTLALQGCWRHWWGLVSAVACHIHILTIDIVTLLRFSLFYSIAPSVHRRKVNKHIDDYFLLTKAEANTNHMNL